MDSRVLVLATIFLFLFSHFPSQIRATDLKLLEKVCGSSKDRSSCLKTLQADLKTKSFSALKEISEVALASTRKGTAEIRDLFDTKLKTAPNKAFKDCASYFDEAIGQLDLRGLEDGTASLDIHYAYDSVDYCEKALSNAKINDPSIAAKIEEWRKIYSVASSAVNAAEAVEN